MNVHMWCFKGERFSNSFGLNARKLSYLFGRDGRCLVIRFANISCIYRRFKEVFKLTQHSESQYTLHSSTNTYTLDEYILWLIKPCPSVSKITLHKYLRRDIPAWKPNNNKILQSFCKENKLIVHYICDRFVVGVEEHNRTKCVDRLGASIINPRDDIRLFIYETNRFVWLTVSDNKWYVSVSSDW